MLPHPLRCFKGSEINVCYPAHPPWMVNHVMNNPQDSMGISQFADSDFGEGVV